MEYPPQQPRLFENEKTPEDIRPEYEVLYPQELRERYIHLTDKLIHKVEDQTSDALIFLDKSARPVAWMFKEIWPLLHPDEPRPDIYFLNIDREQWRPFVGGKESGTINVDDLPKSQMSDLRSLFTHSLIEDDQSGYDHATRLDGKNVLIVDEVKVTGDTLDIARDMLARAMPEANFGTTWWMIPEIKAKPGQPSTNQELPVWYSDETNIGRGVGNRDTSKSQASPSRRQRRGGLFLSTRLRKSDQLSNQLRLEMKQLKNDILDRRLTYMPDYSRDDLAEVFQKINGISLDEYIAEKKKF